MKNKQIIILVTFIALVSFSTFTSLNALDIYGPYVFGENYVLNDSLHIHPGGSIMNEDGNDYVTLTVLGNIINEGTITDNSVGGSLTVRANGNVTNNGTWDCIATYLVGSTEQHVSCLNSHSFQSPNFYNDNTNNIIADGDIYFSDSTIRWQNNGSLDLSAGYDLHIDQGYLYQANILGGNDSEINMTGNAYLYNVSADNMVLSGTVIINSDVTFTGNVSNTGVLQNRSGWYYTLTVNGNLINTGTIQDNGSDAFYIDITGDVTNNGIWQNYDTELIGTSDQHISCGLGNVFEPNLFWGNSSRGNIYFDTDVAFAGTHIDLNNDNLILAAGTTLSLSGGNLRNGTVIADNAVLNMTDDAYLYYVEIENPELHGICQVNGNDVVFDGTTTVTGTLRNKYNYGQSCRLTVNGNIVNNGTITNYTNMFYIDITGDVTNNGIWQNYDIELTGTTDQHISCPTDSSFVISYFRGNSSRGNIYFDTDIEFVGTIIDLNSDNLILQAGNTLTLTGGRITDGIVTANNAVINMTADADLYDVQIENAEFQGTCQVYSNEVVFSGVTTVTGILQNKHSYSSTFTLTLNGNIINNGTIRNGSTSSQLSIHITGDIQITNNGIWQNYDIELIGTTDQHISCSGAGSFAIYYFWGNSSRGNIYFDTDIEFVGTAIDLNSDNLILQSGNTLTLTGGRMFDGSVTTNNAVLNMTDDAYIQDITIENAELQGICQVYSNVEFSGTTTVTGILQNKHSYNSTFTLNVNGNIINNGTIRNGSTSSNLSVYIAGEVVSNGSWSNYRTSLNGTSDQTISLENSNYLAGDVRFISDITGSSYQWNFNYAPLNSPNFGGETSVELDWNVPVNGDYVGTYNCDVSSRILSRNIIVTEPAPPIMEMTLVTDSSIDFGTLYIGQNNTQEVIILNDGNVDLSVSDVSFSAGSSSTFSYTYDNLGGAIAQGTTNSIFVTFTPGEEGSFTGTLEITNNSTNNPLFQILLSGSGEYDEIPSPQNVTLILNSGNATISWDAVTQTVHGIPVTIDFYVLNYSEIPLPDPEEYFHLVMTPQTTFEHVGVSYFAPQMFYQVIAIRDYEGQYTVRSGIANSQLNKTTWKEYKALIEIK